jgi:hypothetical protein
LTEIPEHLLKRSKAARAAKTGRVGGAGSAPAAPGGSVAPTPRAATSPTATVGSTPLVPTADLPDLDPEPPPAGPEAPFVTAARSRKRIPVWALPVVAALPVWALSFAGTMQEPEVEDPLFTESEALYGGCSGCHGAAGGGGTGYELAGGSVLETFPSPIDQMVHVARGSAAIQGEEYGAERGDGRRVAGDLGLMPAQEGVVTQVELEMLVFHERAVLSDEDTSAPGYEAWMDDMRERYESGESEAVDLELLLQCADPEITPGATGEGSDDEDRPCPGPTGGEGTEAALSG